MWNGWDILLSQLCSAWPAARGEGGSRGDFEHDGELLTKVGGGERCRWKRAWLIYDVFQVSGKAGQWIRRSSVWTRLCGLGWVEPSVSPVV